MEGSKRCLVEIGKVDYTQVLRRTEARDGLCFDLYLDALRLMSFKVTESDLQRMKPYRIAYKSNLNLPPGP